MEAHRAPVRWTYEKYALLPESGRTRYEVIADEVVVTPSPNESHQIALGNLQFALETIVRANDLGRVYPSPFDVLFQEGDYFEPDLLFVRKDRLHVVSRRGVEEAPDLVVEVVSASTSSRDRGIKRDRYRMFGVREYWIVDGDARTVEVWRFEAADNQGIVLGEAETLRWRPFPGGDEYELPVARVFEGIP